MPRALITGITGQDGSYLAELLLAKGYEVHGLVRASSQLEKSALAPFVSRLTLHVASLTEAETLKQIVATVAPDELYHLAAQTHVGPSVTDPLTTLDFNTLGTARLLEACRTLSSSPRFFHASTSQIFGQPAMEPQDETTPFRPVNPYGVSKAAATSLVRIAREAQGLFAVNGILYNHESPRRGPEFVTAKICRAAAAIKQGRASVLKLGDTTAQRDWGDARDFVEGFWLALQASRPDDYVFATGELHSVQEVIEIAFETVGLNCQAYVQTDSTLFRAADPKRLLGNPAKARRELGWQPRTPFHQLITEMTETALVA
jgi:GDPmannose 4,6-dehydratase